MAQNTITAYDSGHVLKAISVVQHKPYFYENLSDPVQKCALCSKPLEQGHNFWFCRLHRHLRRSDAARQLDGSLSYNGTQRQQTWRKP